jgi:hypothetical protein
VDPADRDSVWINDTLHFEFGILKGLLPLYGSIALDRVGIGAPLMRGESLNFFDENLLLGRDRLPLLALMGWRCRPLQCGGRQRVSDLQHLTRING